MSFFAPGEFVPLAYDAGSVTTGVLTAPIVISIAIGLSGGIGSDAGSEGRSCVLYHLMARRFIGWGEQRQDP